MIRVAVVEDDPIYQKQLLGYLDQYAAEHGESIKTTVFSDGGAIAFHYKAEYDIILMDIELGAVNGMEAAEMIRSLDGEVVIIFITNMAQFAMKGYQVEALDFVLKPISYYAFSQRIQRALERMSHRRREYICVNVDRTSVKKLALPDIYYVEVREHTLIYHTSAGDIPVSGSMREVEKQLDGKGFFRCNKGYLINLEHVDGMQEDDAVVAGERIQISRSKKKAFLDALNNHINEVGK